MIIVTCPNCKTKFPADVGKKNICPNCGFVVYLERRVNYPKTGYEKMKTEYEIRYEIRRYIREHPHKNKEEIIKELEYIIRKKGFAPEIINEEFSHLRTKK